MTNGYQTWQRRWPARYCRDWSQGKHNEQRIEDGITSRAGAQHSWFWPLASGIELADEGLKLFADNLKFAAEAGKMASPPPPEWATSNHVLMDLHTMRLRDFSPAAPGVVALSCVTCRNALWTRRQPGIDRREGGQRDCRALLRGQIGSHGTDQGHGQRIAGGWHLDQCRRAGCGQYRIVLDPTPG